jgi:NAD(P)-dependent dehydrogenase (short-subunit alcohol dehydrogenase family)
MNQRIAAVSGATSGIGKTTALGLLREGYHVILICRDRDKGEAVKQELLRLVPKATAELAICDLEVPASVKACGTQLRSRLSHLDILVNNAGGIFKKRQLTQQGQERTIALNHFGYFLLTHQLLPLLRKAPQARIVNVSSEAHRLARSINWDDLNAEKRYSVWRQYGLSKLFNILFTRELARRLEGTSITANCLHPGVVRTNFGQNDPGLMKFIAKYMSFFMITPEKGAETSLFLATSPTVASISGVYFDKCRSRKPSPLSMSNAEAARLWDESLKICQIETFGEV